MKGKVNRALTCSESLCLYFDNEISFVSRPDLSFRPARRLQIY